MTCRGHSPPWQEKPATARKGVKDVSDIEALQMLPAEEDEATRAGIITSDVCTVFLSCFAGCP
jgi:hypothetical protein